MSERRQPYDEFADDEVFEEPAFECAGYWDGAKFYCPLAGSEECEWECDGGFEG
ncbi:hypothetical protein QQS45_00035 [Alteriqipengyuania flavescens]|uniref:hypothetical protein n=1 Tax=Alteriqipengyuania flavescens TaxID=3053610 RepID=UPI0025B622D2|nr:hypothetical protein [Alteriqipengyuania flavescens]WJY18678.1 hypothetical protein QQW98_00035 [Alteriqipengyuania flavescens]WJY24618.1 hypothetical protein QQS45_00035 [Alteriqipengyuania flavescens]